MAKQFEDKALNSDSCFFSSQTHSLLFMSVGLGLWIGVGHRSLHAGFS